MSCDEIKVIEQTNNINLITQQDQVDVVSEDVTIEIVSSSESVKVTDVAEETIIINASDVIFAGSMSLDIDMGCSINEQVNDAVYVSGANLVSRANASSIDTAEVIGFIVSKASDTSCKVRINGTVDGFSGLTAGEIYFLAETDGNITTTPVTAKDSVLFAIAKAINDTEIIVTTSNQDFVIRS